MSHERAASGISAVSGGLEAVLGSVRATGRQWRAWGAADVVLAGFDDERLRGVLREADPRRQDVILGALVGVARNGPYEDAAVMVLARCLLPGLRSRMARLAPSVERGEALAVMAAALVERIHAFDLADPPGFVAGFLLEGPSERLRRVCAVERAWTAQSRSVPETAEDGADVAGLSAATLLGLGVDAGVLTAGEAWLVDATRVGGVALRDAAVALGVSYEAARKRRRRAETRWAAWWDPERYVRGNGQEGRR